MTTEPMTVSYVTIRERRTKAVQIDLGEQQPVWFSRSRITLDETAYTITAAGDLMREKLEESRGAPTKRNDFDQQTVRLAPHAWEDDTAIGIDVIVSRLDRGRDAIRKRVFFPKKMIENGVVPRWLVNRKEKELYSEICQSGRYAPENFNISGLRARPKT